MYSSPPYQEDSISQHSCLLSDSDILSASSSTMVPESDGEEADKVISPITEHSQSLTQHLDSIESLHEPLSYAVRSFTDQD